MDMPLWSWLSVNILKRDGLTRFFPWIVGIRSFIYPSLIVSLLNFLDIPSKYRKVAVECTVLASVKALYFMHQVRFGGMCGRMQAVDSRQKNSSDDDEELTPVAGRESD